MLDEHAAERHDLLHDGDDLIGVAPAAWHVFEPRRHPECPRFHPRTHEGPHPLHLLRRREPPVVVAQNLGANRVVAHHEDRVGTDLLIL